MPPSELDKKSFHTVLSVYKVRIIDLFFFHGVYENVEKCSISMEKNPKFFGEGHTLPSQTYKPFMSGKKCWLGA